MKNRLNSTITVWLRVFLKKGDKNKMNKYIMIMAITVFLSGCASIVSKSEYPVSLNSVPDGATVTVMNKSGITISKVKTPAIVTLNASHGFFQPEKYSLSFEKDGYEKKIATISAGMDEWYIGNIIFGGLIGALIVDPATGAMWKLPMNTTVSLHKRVADRKAELKVMSISQIPDEWKHQLVKIQ